MAQVLKSLFKDTAMKQIILTTALTGLFSLSFTAAQPGSISAQSPPITQTQTQSTIIAPDKVGLGKIRPRMSEQQVRSILGKPTSRKTEFMPSINDNILILKYPNISLSLVPNADEPENYFVFEFVTRTRKFATPTGVKVGDTQSQVIQAYGKPYISQEGEFTLLAYEAGSERSTAAFTFRIEAGKVTEINYVEQLI